MRQAEIYRKNILAGTLTEDGGEYHFCYDEAYLAREDAQPVSLTLPLQAETFVSPVLFPFFDGLIPKHRHQHPRPNVTTADVLQGMYRLGQCCCQTKHRR